VKDQWTSTRNLEATTGDATKYPHPTRGTAADLWMDVRRRGRPYWAEHSGRRVVGVVVKVHH
jgi:hypothetical protein